jgi:hypothetical protein
MWFRRCNTERCCHPGTDPCRTLSVPTQQDTPGSEDNARVPLSTRARVSCFVHAMAESTAFAAFGEHAALHVGGVCNRSVVSKGKMSRMFRITDHWDSRRWNTSPSLCGKCLSSGKCLGFPAMLSTRLRYGCTLLFDLRRACKTRQSCEAPTQGRYWEKTSPLLQKQGQQKR